jgi:hypothetical protein
MRSVYLSWLVAGVHVIIGFKVYYLQVLSTVVHLHIHTKPSCSLVKEVNFMNITILDGIPLAAICIERKS